MRKNVDSKLSNLAEFCKLFQGDINERRNQIMEFTIIVLIAIEVIPFYTGCGKKVVLAELKSGAVMSEEVQLAGTFPEDHRGL